MMMLRALSRTAAGSPSQKRDSSVVHLAAAAIGELSVRAATAALASPARCQSASRE